MKRKATAAVVILLSLTFCAACENTQKDNTEIKKGNAEIKYESWQDIIEYETGQFYNKNWNETFGTYNKKAVIPDKETAIKAAQAIFDGMEKSEKVQEYVPQYVFYDNQDEVWIVAFWKRLDENTSDMVTVGEDCCIALQKKDGKVLRIWFEE